MTTLEGEKATLVGENAALENGQATLLTDIAALENDKAALATAWDRPGLSWTYAGGFICKQPGDLVLGVRVYAGSSDNPGVLHGKVVEACALACFLQTTPNGYGPWSVQGPATGFSLTGDGRCYCNHLPLATCTRAYTNYDAYAFN